MNQTTAAEDADNDADAADESDAPREPTEAQRRRLTAALANLDDASLRRGFATMREQSRLEVAQQLNLSKATMHLGDALAPLARRKTLAASAGRQLAVAFALTEETNERAIAALGDRSDDPSQDDLLEVLPAVIEAQGLPLVTLLLTAYAASDAKSQAVCNTLLDNDERFALPDPPEADEVDDAPGIVTFTRDAEDPAQVAKRAQRKEAKAAKRAAETARRDAREHAQTARKSAQHRAKKQRPRSS